MTFGQKTISSTRHFVEYDIWSIQPFIEYIWSNFFRITWKILENFVVVTLPLHWWFSHHQCIFTSESVIKKKKLPYPWFTNILSDIYLAQKYRYIHSEFYILHKSTKRKKERKITSDNTMVKKNKQVRPAKCTQDYINHQIITFNSLKESFSL